MITEQEAKAIDFCGFATDAELEGAYARASMHGNGKVCDILLNEIDKRGVNALQAVGL